MLFHRLTTLLIGITFMYMLSCDGPSTQNNGAAVQLADTHNLNPAFWDYAVSSNLLQVELGQLASEQGSTQQIKDWGKKAANYHGKALQQLKKLGSGHNAIQMPDSLSGADKKMVMEFAALQGADFDTRYREYIITSHKSQVGRYEEAMRKTDSSGLKKWLSDMQQHMQDQIQEVYLADSLQGVTAKDTQ